MRPDETERICDIDRTERTRVGYTYERGALVRKDVVWDSAPWRDGDGEHSFANIIRGADEALALGGAAFGAFEEGRLVGIAAYRPSLRGYMAQLSLLHVSNGYRRQGVASRLFDEVLSLARRDGATALYVSSTPSGSAVGFYTLHGFEPTDAPDPDLYAEEPDDIHMVLEI